MDGVRSIPQLRKRGQVDRRAARENRRGLQLALEGHRAVSQDRAVSREHAPSAGKVKAPLFAVVDLGMGHDDGDRHHSVGAEQDGGSIAAGDRPRSPRGALEGKLVRALELVVPPGQPLPRPPLTSHRTGNVAAAATAPGPSASSSKGTASMGMS